MSYVWNGVSFLQHWVRSASASWDLRSFHCLVFLTLTLGSVNTLCCLPRTSPVPHVPLSFFFSLYVYLLLTSPYILHLPHAMLTSPAQLPLAKSHTGGLGFLWRGRAPRQNTGDVYRELWNNRDCKDKFHRYLFLNAHRLGHSSALRHPGATHIEAIGDPHI